LTQMMNCDRLFNILCLYGNVVRIKFLRSKTDAAMVQMSDNEAIEQIKENLDNVNIFDSNLRITLSKQPYLADKNETGTLPDGTPIFKDYKENRCNRFLDPTKIMPKAFPPHTIIHYYNAPPGYGEEDLNAAIEAAGAVLPDRIKVLGLKNGKNSSGLLQWVKQSDANDAMVLCNHMKLEQLPNYVLPGKRPNSYTLKFCFSQVPFIG